MRTRNRSVAWLLILFMLVVLISGCTKSGEDEETTSPTTQTEAPAPVTTTVEKVTYGGREFSISYAGYFPIKNADGSYQSSLDEEWDAAYRDLEDRLDIKIIYVPLPEGDALEHLTAAAMSGTVLADLIRTRQNTYWPA
ncbi:MAG TPA: hypothetical protein GX701_09995, partial [Clostridiales bacterium]|nr:hypothetical protein [Clostridiales bacterium]